MDYKFSTVFVVWIFIDLFAAVKKKKIRQFRDTLMFWVLRKVFFFFSFVIFIFLLTSHSEVLLTKELTDNF